MKPTLIRPNTLQWFIIALTTAFIATFSASAFCAVPYGGVFNDGALHVVTNLVAHEPYVFPGTGATGALVSNGSTLRIPAAGLVDVSATTGYGHAIGIQVSDTARAEVLSGANVDVADSSTRDSIGLIASGQSVVDFRGNLDISEIGVGSATIGVVSDSAILNFSGSATVHEDTNGVVNGFLVSSYGRVNFSGSANMYATGNRDAIPFRATGNASIDYSGNMYAELATSTLGPIVLDGNASVRMTGGSLTVAAGGIGTPPKFFSINEDASVYISGGSLQLLQLGVSKTPYFWMTAQGRLTIAGSNFNLPLGEVIARSGTITGLLSDGTPFSYQFAREEKAFVILVPEPGTGCLVLLGLCCLTTGRRRRGCFLRGGLVGRGRRS